MEKTCQEVQKDTVINASVDVTATHQSVRTALMMCVPHAIVRKMIYRHENFVLDMDSAHRAKLYKDDKLVFLGDGYKAINILIRNSKNSAPVEEKFNAQLKTRQKPAFTPVQDDIEALRLQALKDYKPEKKKKR